MGLDFACALGGPDQRRGKELRFGKEFEFL